MRPVATMSAPKPSSGPRPSGAEASHAALQTHRPHTRGMRRTPARAWTPPPQIGDPPHARGPRPPK
eukprot:scaffold12470_cov119-Isochrysis_galbana.AAC.8